jgi:hypothetical protein
MKVKCKKIYEGNHEITKTGGHDQHLTVGKEYIVLTVYMQDKKAYFQFEGDDGDLIMFHASQFDVVSNYVPSNWEITCERCDDETYYMSLAPKKWNEAKYPSGNGFYEEIVEVEGPLENWRSDPELFPPEVVKLYLQETEVIYREEKEYQRKQKENY